MQKYITINGFRPLNAKFQVHWSVFALGSLILAAGIESPIHSLIALASYLGIIFIHELGHGLMAKRVGCRVHSIKLGFFHGLCTFDAPYDEWDEVKIAWAGVLAQLAVATLVLAPSFALPNAQLGYFELVMVFLGYFNIFWALFNLAPTAALDGKKAWRVIPLAMQQLKARSVSSKALKSLGKK